jgi:hypothetical protein
MKPVHRLAVRVLNLQAVSRAIQSGKRRNSLHGDCNGAVDSGASLVPWSHCAGRYDFTRCDVGLRARHLDLLILALLGSAALIHDERRVGYAPGAIAFLGADIALKLFSMFCISLAAPLASRPSSSCATAALSIIYLAWTTTSLSTECTDDLYLVVWIQNDFPWHGSHTKRNRFEPNWIS